VISQFFINYRLCEAAMSETLSYTIRPAAIEDVDQVYQLICDLAVYEGKDLATLPCKKANLQKYLFGKNAYGSIELAEAGDAIVGYALYYYGFSGHQGMPLLYIDDIYVKEENRGHGVGTALLKRLASLAKEHECCRLEWHVFDWNERAIDFYQKIGGKLRKDLLQIRLEKEAMHRLAGC
jgi:ribosomal protein S18 acetylase RimI-like enzyme